MSNPTRVADQIRHYRELAQIAADCARASSEHANEYRELAQHWFEQAERLERDAAETPAEVALA